MNEMQIQINEFEHITFDDLSCTMVFDSAGISVEHNERQTKIKISHIPRPTLIEHDQSVARSKLLCQILSQNTVPSATICLPKTISDVLEELKRAKKKFPYWPTDPLHALAILSEEFGETAKAALEACYSANEDKEAVYAESIQTAAMAIRFAASMQDYRFGRSPKHQDKVP